MWDEFPFQKNFFFCFVFFKSVQKICFRIQSQHFGVEMPQVSFPAGLRPQSARWLQVPHYCTAPSLVCKCRLRFYRRRVSFSPSSVRVHMHATACVVGCCFSKALPEQPSSVRQRSCLDSCLCDRASALTASHLTFSSTRCEIIWMQSSVMQRRALLRCDRTSLPRSHERRNINGRID